MAPPVTSISGVPFGWETGAAPVSIGLSASDASSAPTITYYQLNSGPVSTYTAPFAVSAEGTTTVRFWSKDSAPVPNIEAVQTRYVRIDRTGPALASNIRAEYAGSARFGFGLTDVHSGAAGAFWYLDGTILPTTEPTGRSLTVTVPGRHTLTWTGFDVAGNEATGSASFIIKRAQTLTRSPAKSTVTLTRRSGLALWKPSVTVRATPGTPPYVGTVPLAGKLVVLQRSTDGLRWQFVAFRTTSAKGTASYTVRLTKAGKARYRWYSQGDASIAASYSAPTVVTVR